MSHGHGPQLRLAVDQRHSFPLLLIDKSRLAVHWIGGKVQAMPWSSIAAGPFSDVGWTATRFLNSDPSGCRRGSKCSMGSSAFTISSTADAAMKHLDQPSFHPMSILSVAMSRRLWASSAAEIDGRSMCSSRLCCCELCLKHTRRLETGVRGGIDGQRPENPAQMSAGQR